MYKGIDDNIKLDKEQIKSILAEEESITFAEERRLFYVRLTRTKNNVYLLVNKNSKLRSTFINELYNIMKETPVCNKTKVNIIFYKNIIKSF